MYNQQGKKKNATNVSNDNVQIEVLEFNAQLKRFPVTFSGKCKALS